MAILTSAFAYLGSYYSDGNPSLKGMILSFQRYFVSIDDIQGQRLYTKGDAESLALIDRQIYRLIGKATTLAA
jgi:citrate synthase